MFIVYCLFIYLFPLATGSSYLFRLTQSSSAHSVTISVVSQDVPALYVSPVVYEIVSDGVYVLSSRVYGSGDILNVNWKCERLEGKQIIMHLVYDFPKVFDVPNTIRNSWPYSEKLLSF